MPVIMWTQERNRARVGGQRRGGYRHRENCPNEEDEEETSSDEEGEEGKDAESAGGEECCSDRRCTTWFDLCNWFGFLPMDLPYADFKACFTDIAHGGMGLYEKLIVLGAKTLETFAELHFYELYASAVQPYVPQELLDLVSSEAIRILWTQKRVESTTSSQALYMFGRSYLATAQGLPTRLAVAKYVKGCIGFSCQSRDSANIYKWMPALIEHVSWTQRVRTEADDHSNALLQDMQTYLGYREDRLLPRIREVVKGKNVPQRSDMPTGKELVRLYAADYFNILAQESGVERYNQAAWADGELQTFMSSPAIPLFAVTCMSLQPYLMHTDSHELPPLELFESTFYSLVAACWVLSTEVRVKIWMPALIQRLRQVQLLARLSSLEGSAYARATRRRKLAAHPIELSQIAAANNGAFSCFGLWDVDPRKPAMPQPIANASRTSVGTPAFSCDSRGISSTGTQRYAQAGASCCGSFRPAASPGYPTTAPENTSRAAVLPPPPDRSLLIAEPGTSSGDNPAQLQRVTLKPFGRLVLPVPRRRGSRTSRAQQSPSVGSACCVWNVNARVASPCAAGGSPTTAAAGTSPAPQSTCCCWPGSPAADRASSRRSRSPQLKIHYSPVPGRLHAGGCVPGMDPAEAHASSAAREAVTGKAGPIATGGEQHGSFFVRTAPEDIYVGSPDLFKAASPRQQQFPRGQSSVPLRHPSADAQFLQQQRLQLDLQRLQMEQLSMQQQLQSQLRWQLQHQPQQRVCCSVASPKTRGHLTLPLLKGPPGSRQESVLPSTCTSVGAESMQIGHPAGPAAASPQRQNEVRGAPLVPLNAVDVLVYPQRPLTHPKQRLPTPLLLPPVPSGWLHQRESTVYVCFQ